MKERTFGISYFFTPTPTVKDVAEKEIIEYNPIVVYKEDGGELKEIKNSRGFRIDSRELVMDDHFLHRKKTFYTEMQKRSRAAQERIISEYICAIILHKVREIKNDRLTFLIRDEFRTEKIVGRLGYLGLPMERLRILFVSCNLAAFMGNFIEQYAVPLRSDLTILFSDQYRNQVLGPFPEDDGITMLKTFYCSFPKEDIYPLKIDLFCQMLNKEDLSQEQQHIRDIFMDNNSQETFPMSGGKSTDYTRLPKVLTECEERVSYYESCAALE